MPVELSRRRHFQKSGERFPLSWRRVALLGIAHRSILVKCAQKSKVEPKPKPLAENAKTVGDWIKANREQKNLTSGHVALKMGIAHALVLSWETNERKPDIQQWAGLARAFGVDADAVSFPQELVMQAAA
ncbi:MAG TPA: helix-turn-helix transcriptional regulator [Verrucomicrobiae bacterium]|nr:helix-turn-helix transcriptional regulator [Verrucomicrobiae bacterium]